MTNHRVDRAVPISTSSARSQSLNQCTINCHKTGAAPGTNSFMAARMCHDSVSPGKSGTEPVTSKAVCLFTVAYLTTVSPFSVTWYVAMVHLSLLFVATDCLVLVDTFLSCPSCLFFLHSLLYLSLLSSIVMILYLSAMKIEWQHRNKWPFLFLVMDCLWVEVALKCLLDL